MNAAIAHFSWYWNNHIGVYCLLKEHSGFSISSVHLFKLSTIHKNDIGSYLEKENQGYNEAFIMEVNGDMYWRI